MHLRFEANVKRPDPAGKKFVFWERDPKTGHFIRKSSTTFHVKYCILKLSETATPSTEKLFKILESNQMNTNFEVLDASPSRIYIYPILPLAVDEKIEDEGPKPDLRPLHETVALFLDTFLRPYITADHRTELLASIKTSAEKMERCPSFLYDDELTQEEEKAAELPFPKAFPKISLAERLKELGYHLDSPKSPPRIGSPISAPIYPPTPPASPDEEEETGEQKKKPRGKSATPPLPTDGWKTHCREARTPEHRKRKLDDKENTKDTAEGESTLKRSKGGTDAFSTYLLGTTKSPLHASSSSSSSSHPAGGGGGGGSESPTRSRSPSPP